MQKLKKDHLVELKSLNNPVDTVRLVLGGMVILFQDYIKKELKGEIILKPDPDPKALGKKVFLLSLPDNSYIKSFNNISLGRGLF